ncbi:hypothetical protein BDN72DRAFT_177184 [Pluteus cervinus]|uniref:Uncharacterized protein n=1 Tax=Pluteus cervinus TaxID=181527 RepID=A0ACD3AKW8_9AGAR|nr:hypothetical protein BDN72DRAFT_177184 [Pluteus cervinus]
MSSAHPSPEFYMVQNLRYAIAAAYTVQVFEWIAAFPDEVKLIHRTRWCSVKVAYLLCRYYPLLSFPVLMWAYLGNYSREFCAPVIQPVGALFAPFQVFPQGRRCSILAALAACFGAVVAISVWVFCSGASALPSEMYQTLRNTGCFSNYAGDVMGLRLGIVLLTATLMDLVSLIIVIWHCRKALSSGWELATYFIRQGLASFALISMANGVAAILYFESGSSFSRSGLPFAFTICNVIACRVTLQLREKAEETDEEPEDETSKVYSFTVSSSPGLMENDPWLIDD